MARENERNSNTHTQPEDTLQATDATIELRT